MNDRPSRERLFGAAVLRLSFELRGATSDPGFRFVYRNALKDLGLDDEAVVLYIGEHRDELERHIRSNGKSG
jgi:hypothetical protein